MQRVTILGCGYVGMALVPRLTELGYEVTATTTRPERQADLEAIATRTAIVRGDDAAALAQLLASQDSLILTLGAPRADAYGETYRATAQTLAALMPELPQLRQVIYTGSYAVYGDRQGDWVDETSPVAPSTENGKILVETEQILLSLATEHRRVCIFRLGGIYGPGRSLARIFQRAAGTTRPGTGDDASNWIHRDDVVGAIAFAQQQGLQGLYNLVQDEPTTVKQLLADLSQRHQWPPVSWDPSQPSPRPYNARVSNQRLKNAGYGFQYRTLAAELEG
jgi:nucleoside-diphosphate-sugar epimerase